MNDYLVSQVEDALTYHINYGKHASETYLKKMDMLAFGEKGPTQSEKLSQLLNKYYKQANVKNLTEAIKNLKERLENGNF